MPRTPDETAAHELHEAHRKTLVDFARYHAVEIARREGSVDSRRLHARLVELGVVAATREGGTGGAELRWYGTVFVHGPFEITGDVVSTKDHARGVHRGRHAHVWRLKAGADLAPFATPPSAPATARNSPQQGLQQPATDVLKPPLPFDPRRAKQELTYLDRAARLRGESPSPEIERLGAWLDSLAPKN